MTAKPHGTSHRSIGSLALAAGLALAALAAAPAPARADHSWYVGFGGGFYNDLDCCHVHGRVQGEIGWHFGGDDTGFFLELDAIPTFGPDYWMFTGGLRLGGDIEVHRDHHFRLLLRPSGMIGFGARDFDGDGHGPFGHLVIQPAFDLRFVVADGLIAIWARPVAFDFLIWWDHNPAHDWYGSAAYQAMAGIDFQF
jgi:hypothetical protein